MRKQFRAVAIALGVAIFVCITAAPARGDLVVNTNLPNNQIDVKVSEHVKGAIFRLPIQIGNDNVPDLSIKIDSIGTGLPIPVSGDTQYDVLLSGTASDTCDGVTLQPSNNPFTDAGSNCTFGLFLKIGDADTTDTKNPVIDLGEWNQLVFIRWTRADQKEFVTVVTVDVKILDDQVPEPSSLLLLGTGIVGLAGTIQRKLRI